MVPIFTTELYLICIFETQLFQVLDKRIKKNVLI